MRPDEKNEAILIIQTAFLGDVVLASSLAESLHKKFPNRPLDMLVKKGNESLFSGHPFIRKVLVLDKGNGKWRNIFSQILNIRKNQYGLVFNLHRFGSSGLITALSGAKETRGFSKNPFSVFYTKRFSHQISANPTLSVHEIQRNFLLVKDISDSGPELPKLYPTAQDFDYSTSLAGSKAYVCIAPSSVWLTKQLPEEKWLELMKKIPESEHIYLLGGKTDSGICRNLVKKSGRPVTDLSGKLTFLQTCALMKHSRMNFVNDSAPLHFCSAMNAPVTAFFCSTIPEFGFGPLSDNKTIIQHNGPLPCRPCGLHGKKECPEKHFRCGKEISLNS